MSRRAEVDAELSIRGAYRAAAMDPEQLSVRGVFPGEQAFNLDVNMLPVRGESRDAPHGLHEGTDKPSPPTYQSQEPLLRGRTGSSAHSTDTDGAVDEMTVRGPYHPPRGLNGRREQSTGAGVDSVQEIANPPKTSSPSPSGHEPTGLNTADLQQNVSAETALTTTPNSQWRWIQGVFSFNKRDDLESTMERTLERDGSASLDKENSFGAPGSTGGGPALAAEGPGSVAGTASRSLSPSTVLSEKQGHPKEDSVAVQARAATETLAGVVQKMPGGPEGQLKETKSVPGVWIKSVWGTRQEVQELDLAIQMALQMEQIDTSKYFARDYTEFPSVAHYYVHIHDSLDMEEVDLLASFAGRMGEDHPLVQAMMEIMEEDGEGDDALMMDPPDGGGMLKETQEKSADMGVYITESGMLRSVPPGGPSPVAKLPKRPSASEPELEDANVPDKCKKEVEGGRLLALVPGMDDLVNEISAMSWLSKRKPWKPGQPIFDDDKEDGPARASRKRSKSRGSTGQTYGQSPALQASLSPGASWGSPSTQTSSPKRQPVVQEPKEKDPTSPPPRAVAPEPQVAPPKTPLKSKYGAPEAQHVASEVATDTHAHYYGNPGRRDVKESRGLLDIICCRRPLVDEEY